MSILFLNSKAGFAKQHNGGNLVLLMEYSKGGLLVQQGRGLCGPPVPAVLSGYAE